MELFKFVGRKTNLALDGAMVLQGLDLERLHLHTYSRYTNIVYGLPVQECVWWFSGADAVARLVVTFGFCLVETFFCLLVTFGVSLSQYAAEWNP